MGDTCLRLQHQEAEAGRLQSVLDTQKESKREKVRKRKREKRDEGKVREEGTGKERKGKGRRME